MIAAQPGVKSVFRVATMQLGPDTMFAVKVQPDPSLGLADAIQSINATERALKARLPKLKWCFVEPDVTD